MGGDCAHTDVLYGVTLTHLDQNNLPLDEETERYVGELEEPFLHPYGKGSIKTRTTK